MEEELAAIFGEGEVSQLIKDDKVVA